MAKKNAEYYLLQGIVVVSIALICLISYAITDALKVGKSVDLPVKYVSYEVLTDNVMPVIKEDELSVSKEEKNLNIQRPYTDSSVDIGKSYYDYNAKEQEQQKSIIYYENTYLQNSGVDYVSKNTFTVNSVLDGKVLSITTDDITGTTIKIEHKNNLISVYQSVKEVKVKEKDDVTKGQVIASSGTNAISSELGNHLHFELYQEGILVNPESFFETVKGN